MFKKTADLVEDGTPNQPIITLASIKYVVKPPFVTLLRSEKVTSKTK